MYLKCDALLLADAFEQFRNNSLKNYGLRPSHYLRTPALSWDGMLNMTKVELELISDANMYILFEKGMRGGFFAFLKGIVIPTISISNFITQNKKKNIPYLDANNYMVMWCLSLLHQKDSNG